MRAHQVFIAVSIFAGMALAGCRQDDAATLLASAKTYLAADNPKAALIQLKNALLQDEALAEARFLLGKALLATDEPVAAEVELRKVLSANYSPDEVVPELARALLAQNELRRLTDEFGQVALHTPAAMADLQASVAAAQLRRGQTAPAQEAIAAALRAVPGFPAAQLLQARMAASEGHFDRAVELMRGVLAAQPRDADSWQLQGDLLVAAKLPHAEALAAYRQALAIKPELLPSHTAIVLIEVADHDFSGARVQLDALRKALPKHPQQPYLEAVLALEQQDLTAALAQVQQALAVAPEDAKVLRLAGVVALMSGRPDLAQVHFAKAVLIAPADAALRVLLTRTCLLTGQTAQALATLAPLLEPPQVDVQTLSLAAEVYLHSGEFKRAEAFSAAALKADPADVRQRTALALAQFPQRDGSLAVGEPRFEGPAALGGAPGGASGSVVTTSADYARISTALQQRDFDEALAVLDALDRKQPGRPLAAMLRGRVQLARGDAAAARAGFEAALAREPRYFPASAALADLDLRQGQPDAARQRFEALLARDPKHLQALLALADLRRSTGGSPAEVAQLLALAVRQNPLDARPRLLLVEHHQRQAEPKLALAAAQDGVAAMVGNVELLQVQGRVQMAMGDFPQALLSFDQMARLQPQLDTAHLRLAEAYAAMGNDAAAVQSLRRALAINAESGAAQRLLFTLHLAAGRHDDALALARAVQRQRPAEAQGFADEGDVEAARRHWRAAVAAYRVALVKAAPLADAPIRLHAALLAAEQGAQAESFAAAWLREHPRDAAFLFHLADTALAVQGHAVAEARYRSGLRFDADNAPALNNLAWILATQKKPQAVDFAARACALKPASAQYLDTLAFALAADRQFDKAIPAQQKAVALEPGNPTLRLGLARLYLADGDKVKARLELAPLARLGNAFRQQNEVNALLRQM